MLRKRKSMARIVVMFCIVAVAAFASIAQAHDGERGERGGEQCGCGDQHRQHGDKHHHHDFKKFAKKLRLTDAQKAQAKAIFQGNKDAVKPIFTSLRAERENFQTLVHADKIDEGAMRAELAKIAGIKADLIVDRAKAKAKFRAILTPEQLTVLKTLHKKGYEPERHNHCTHE
jgi:Spy/CpxP family protein refolding chaperone